MWPSVPQFSNPITKVGSYLGNIGKEAKQWGSAWGKTLDASQAAKTYPPASAGQPGPTRESMGAKASNLAGKEKAEFGQLAGAILQGRRYDNKGNQITAPKTKP